MWSFGGILILTVLCKDLLPAEELERRDDRQLSNEPLPNSLTSIIDLDFSSSPYMYIYIYIIATTLFLSLIVISFSTGQGLVSWPCTCYLLSPTLLCMNGNENNQAGFLYSRSLYNTWLCGLQGNDTSEFRARDVSVVHSADDLIATYLLCPEKSSTFWDPLG